MSTEPRPSRSRQSGGGGKKGPRSRRSTDSTTLSSSSIAIVNIRFKISPRVWMSRFTRHHPDLEIKGLNLMTVDDGNVVGEFDVLGSPENWSKEIAAFPDVVVATCLGARPNLTMYRVLYRKSRVVALRNELEILVRYPFSDKDGVCRCELVGQRSRLRRFVSELRASGNDPRLLSFRPDDSSSLAQPNLVNLTRIQRALFHQALTSGYYEVPRRVTLTQLAEMVSRNKSSVSKLLDRVERELAEFAATTGA